MSLFNELKRRNVIRVGIAYLIIGWLLAQISTTLEDALNLPAWFDTLIVTVMLLGFPLALLIAWVYELTPEGIKKEKDIKADDSITNASAKKLDYITIAAALAVIGMIVWQQMSPRELDSRLRENDVVERGNDIEVVKKTPDILVKTQTQPENKTIDDKSIAVLPFIALSADENDAYFGKGIAEELLNALVKFPELKVAARTSAFSLGGKEVDLREVGNKLGVAHVLEGSVRSAGDKVRVTAQLIRASDGFHLWSETYDRNMADLFKVQDEIVREINRTLQIRLGVGVGAGRAAAKQVDPVAYQNYLRGLELWGLRAVYENRRNAIQTFQLTTVQDPDFADGWAAYGLSLAHSSNNVTGMNQQHKAASRHALGKALELDSENVRALAGLGVYYKSQEIDVVRATGYLNKALKLVPNSAQARYNWANITVLISDLSAVLQAFDLAISLDPLNQTIQRVYAQALGTMGDYDGVSKFVKNCDACTKSDQELILSAYYMAARRKGTDGQVRVAAALYNTLLIKYKDSIAVSNRKFYIQRQLALSSPAFVEMLLGGPTLSKQELNVLRSLFKEEVYFNQLIVLAQIGETELVLNLLSQAYQDNLNELNVITQPMGRDVWPDSVRRDPRFHAFWEKPGMSELAALLRKKGKTVGLPLPMEGNDS